MAWSIILAEGLTIPLIAIFANNISFVALCMGRRELFYSYDYFHLGGFSIHQGYQSCNGNDHIIYLLACNIMRIVNYLIWSNLIDFYFLLKIMLVLKNSTISAKKLLTPKALTERKRYFFKYIKKFISIYSNVFLNIFRNNGIIIAISFWQCLAEFCVNVLLCIIFYKFHGQDQFVDTFALLNLIFFSYVVFPSIYLLADQRFRNAMKQRGIPKAFWSALKQKYD